jgi:hypothetical protein
MRSLCWVKWADLFLPTLQENIWWISQLVAGNKRRPPIILVIAITTLGASSVYTEIRLLKKVVNCQNA